MTCLTTGPVTCRVRLDRGGYVPGEAINIWATIDNQSKVTIKGTRSCLTEVRNIIVLLYLKQTMTIVMRLCWCKLCQNVSAQCTEHCQKCPIQ